MRIATITFQQNATSQMNNLQADLAKTQNDLATGTRLHSAADDPSAMSQVNALNVQMSASTQYVTNGNYATSTLQLEEQAMSDATNTLQSARDLAVEANNPALSASQRADIAAQLQQQLQDLIAIGNRVDGSGNQIFAGTASNTVPFSQNGDDGLPISGADKTSQIQIGPNQRISAGDTGAAVFMNIPGRQRHVHHERRRGKHRHRLDRRRHGLQRGRLGAGHLHDCVHEPDQLHRHEQHRHSRLDCDQLQGRRRDLL